MTGIKLSSKKVRWILAILVGAAALAWAFVPRAMSVELAEVSRGVLIERVQVEGRLEARRHQIITALADGDLKRMPLEVGDFVPKGGVITELYWDMAYVPIRAPWGGVISKVFRESAGPIRRGEPIVELVDPARLEVVAELLTPEAVQIRDGNPVRIRGWGGEGVLEARVTGISRAGFTKPSALGVEEERTEVRMMPVGEWPRETRSRLGSHFHVDVEIETGRLENVLVMPVGALFREGERWACYVARSGKAELQLLELGRRSDESVEILSGLRESERVILYPGEFVRPGLRIKAMRQ
jgi:HlyD family secretion protein